MCIRDRLANEHCDVITPTKRSAVLKAFFFMEKPEYTAKLEELNAELKKLPVCDWKGTKVVTSAIICDNPKLLEIFEQNNIAIAADDVAHESRSFRVDVPEDETDPIRALAKQFANMDYDVLLYDPKSTENRRAESVSYTHLDVYKRQPRHRYRCGCQESYRYLRGVSEQRGDPQRSDAHQDPVLRC